MIFVTNYLLSPSLKFAILVFINPSLVVKFLKIQIFTTFLWINAKLRLAIVKYMNIGGLLCFKTSTLLELVFLLRLNIFHESRLQVNDKGINNKSKYFFFN